MDLSLSQSKDRYKLAIVFLFMLLTITVSAQDDKPKRHSVSMEGAITSDITWNWEISYRYKFLNILSAGIGAGMWKQMQEDGLPSGDDWILDDDDSKMSNFYLRPNIMITTPKLFAIRDCEFSLFANPGLMMNIPYASSTVDILTFEGNVGHVTDYKHINNHKGKWAAFDIRAGIRFGTDDVHFLLGYQFSTLDIYGMQRDMTFDHQKFDEFYPKRKPQHAAVLEIAIDF